MSLICPKCEKKNVKYRTTTNDYKCFSCGFSNKNKSVFQLLDIKPPTEQEITEYIKKCDLEAER